MLRRLADAEMTMVLLPCQFDGTVVPCAVGSPLLFCR